MTPQQQAGGFAGIGVLSSIFGGISKIQQGQAEKSADDYNAAITLQNTAAKMVASQQQYSKLAGKQGSAYASSGVDISSGSPLLMMAATAGRGGEEAEQIRQAGTEEATLQQYYGKLAAWSGTMSGIGTFLSGISSTLSTYAGTTFNPAPSAAPSIPGGGDIDV
jgi:hypothetical protein